jgi:hypothetical protein
VAAVTPEEARQRMYGQEDAREWRRLAGRLIGWSLLLAALAVVAWVAVDH